ncbi:hypothetical protein AQUCO_00500622v1 [Aquilegia coerulea]|uniref:Uncharacterized protein n=1 Tax=Aquilegia coerulea TaxID=218851 RepID=A0A2G5ESS7_AQUCA|nr:hypothetical protein AQUCO_00500622v1 [Aquilegia coerulea]
MNTISCYCFEFGNTIKLNSLLAVRLFALKGIGGESFICDRQKKKNREICEREWAALLEGKLQTFREPGVHNRKGKK